MRNDIKYRNFHNLMFVGGWKRKMLLFRQNADAQTVWFSIIYHRQIIANDEKKRMKREKMQNDIASRTLNSFVIRRTMPNSNENEVKSRREEFTVAFEIIDEFLIDDEHVGCTHFDFD